MKMIINKDKFIFRYDHPISIKDRIFLTNFFESKNILVDGFTHTITVSKMGDHIVRFNALLNAKQLEIKI
jgi:hypothetical protein